MKMKQLIYTLCIAIAFSFNNAQAQTFIKKAQIEFEVKTNMKRALGNNSWAERIKDMIPQFKTAYYNYTYSDNKAIYKFARWEDNSKLPPFLRGSDESNYWYMDYTQGIMQMKKDVFGSNFDIEDSLTKIKWKLTNESREIAGFNCRKAVGVMMDSIYVFAFYTDELMISGGPCSINGLPGMVLGMTIPRMYTSWMATKVQVVGVNDQIIVPSNAKKKMNTKEVSKTIIDRTKDWIDPSDPDSGSFISQMLWGVLL